MYGFYDLSAYMYTHTLRFTQLIHSIPSIDSEVLTSFVFIRITSRRPVGGNPASADDAGGANHGRKRLLCCVFLTFLSVRLFVFVLLLCFLDSVQQSLMFLDFRVFTLRGMELWRHKV